MTLDDLVTLGVGALQGLTFTSMVVLVVFIGFCVIFGFTKTKRTAGAARVVKSLEEAVSHQPVHYLPPTAPRGPADQLRSPELVEAAARK